MLDMIGVLHVASDGLLNFGPSIPRILVEDTSAKRNCCRMSSPTEPSTATHRH